MDIDFSKINSKLIIRGAIFRSNEFKGIGHPKIFVVVGEDSKNNVLGYYFINSNINENVIKNKKEIYDMQMFVKRVNYPTILKYDSFIGCPRWKQCQKGCYLRGLMRKKPSTKAT